MAERRRSTPMAAMKARRYAVETCVMFVVLGRVGVVRAANGEGRADSVVGPAERFGERGEFVVTAELALSASYSHAGAGVTMTRVGIQPALAYFVAPRVSVGGSVFVSYSDASSNYEVAKATAFGGALNVGYAVPLGKVISWWPLLNLGYSSNHTQTTLGVLVPAGGLSPSPSTTPLEYTTRLFSAEVFTPVLLHPAEHFFVGLGPYFDTGVPVGARSANEEVTFTVGVGTTVGGWW